MFSVNNHEQQKSVKKSVSLKLGVMDVNENILYNLKNISDLSVRLTILADVLKMQSISKMLHEM